MSTRSNIAVLLKPEDIGRSLNYLDNREAKIKCSGAREQVGEPEDIYKSFHVSDDVKVLQIYSHYDGYPSHMLNELITHFNTYEKALSLVLAGDTSGIYDGVSEVYALGEGYTDNAPCAYEFPHLEQEYIYIFNPETNEWTYEE